MLSAYAYSVTEAAVTGHKRANVIHLPKRSGTTSVKAIPPSSDYFRGRFFICIIV